MTRRLALAALLACSSPSATISVTTGGEADALTRDPAVTSLTLDAVDQTGNRTQLTTVTLPDTSAIDLGDQSQTLIASLQLTGKDAAGDTVVFGATPSVELGALAGGTIPLFVQRKGELARMPGTTEDGRATPFVATSGRGIYFAGGSLSGTPGPLNLGGYDLLSLQAFTVTCELLTEPKSFALVQLAQQSSNLDYAYAALVDAGGFTYVGLPSCGEVPITTVPTGLKSWGDVAGGRTVMGDDGTAYVVGGSRTDPPTPTNAVVAFGPGTSTTAGTVTAGVTSATRLGAAVVWVPSHGVFVYGGSSDTQHTGAEYVNASLVSDPLPYPPDAASGMAAVLLDDHTVLLAGGDLPQPETIDLGCQLNCAPATWGPPLPALTSPSLFALGEGAFLLVGDDASGATTVFRLTATETAPQAVALKNPRHGARAVQIATGAVIILGGGSSTPESYVE